jgi:hypothetical protein
MPAEGGLAKGNNVFTGWNISKSGGGTSYPPESPYTVTANQTFYAQWTDPALVYTVTYNANGANGALPSQQKVVQGGSVTAAGKGNLTNGNKTFDGWNTQADGSGTGYNAGAMIPITGNTTLYAQWTDPAQTYTVTYNANGASGTLPAQQTALKNGSITVAGKGNLANGNKTFGGWNTQADGQGTGYNAGASLIVTVDTTLYAQWVDQQYTVTYLANGAGGTPPSVQTVNEGSSITLPDAGGLTNSGKTFNGWNTAAAGSGTAYAEGASYTVNANTNFYAQWTNEPITPPGATLAEKLAYIAGQADDGTVYDIEVTQNEYLEPAMVATQGKNVVVNLRSADAGDIKVIQIYSTGTLLTVNNNITLTLQNITLKGRPGNDTVLVKVALGGAMVMNQNAKIRDNTSKSDGSGLYIDSGTVTMNDGEISGNNIAEGWHRSGGGVYVTNGGTMVINGGKITGNSAFWGGGINITGTSSVVTMHGGEISNNTARNTNTYGGYGSGGGIYLTNDNFASFAKTSISADGRSGVIYGSSAGPGLANTSANGFGAAIGGTGSPSRNDTLGQFDEY